MTYSSDNHLTPTTDVYIALLLLTLSQSTAMSISTSEQQPMGDALIQPGETKQMAIERLEGELSELSDTASRLEDVALIAAGKADFAARKSRETASRGMRGDLDTSRLLQDAANVGHSTELRLVCADVLSSCAGQSPVLCVAIPSWAFIATLSNRLIRCADSVSSRGDYSTH